MSQLPKENVKNYILIHGAWHGSWCWYKILSHLTSLGHKVVALDLPGHGEHKKFSPPITLHSYVHFIEHYIKSAKQKVILVGHSMAGAIISQVAENNPEYIEELVYISGIIPSSKASLMDEEKQFLFPTTSKHVSIHRKEKMILLPFENPQCIIDLFYGHSTSCDQAYALRHIQPQYLQPFIDKIFLTSPRFGTVKKTYIACLHDNAISFSDQQRIYSKIKPDVLYVKSDHSPFFSADVALAKMLHTL